MLAGVLVFRPTGRSDLLQRVAAFGYLGTRAMPDATTITPDDVRKVAKLARLSLDDADVARLTGQLESILGYVRKINQVDLTGVAPLAHALPVHNVLREDVPGPPLPLDKVLQNAPDANAPFFKVPKVIGGDEDSAG